MSLVEGTKYDDETATLDEKNAQCKKIPLDESYTKGNSLYAWSPTTCSAFGIFLGHECICGAVDTEPCKTCRRIPVEEITIAPVTTSTVTTTKIHTTDNCLGDGFSRGLRRRDPACR